MDAEGGPDLNLNPVVQARFLVERERAQAQGRQGKRGAGAYGALRKLKLDIKGKKDEKQRGGLNIVDMALQKEAQDADKAEKAALKLVAEAEATRQLEAAAKRNLK